MSSDEDISRTAVRLRTSPPMAKRDEYTSFRWFLLRSEYRDRHKKCGCDLDIIYLKELWEEQKGICPLTGWELILPNDTRKAFKDSDPRNASLDRIDPSKGYVRGNVRYISYMANIAKHKFTDEQLIEFCRAVSSQ